MSFECPHCGFTNNEIQSAGRIQEKGCTMKLSVSSPEVQTLWELIQMLKFFITMKLTLYIRLALGNHAPISKTLFGMFSVASQMAS